MSAPRGGAIAWCWNASVAALTVAGLALAFSRTWADPDLWGHVRFGQDLWRTGHIVRADAYSYLTGQQPWINHEWLSEAIFAAFFSLAGPVGLAAMKLGVALVLAVALYARLVRHDGLDPLPAGLWLMAYTVLIVPGVATVRPQMFSYLLFVILLWLIDAAERGARWSLAAVPPLFALWANLHGAFLVGLGMLIVWAAARVASNDVPVVRAPRRSGVLLAAAAAVAATLINPYGLGLWRSLLSVTDRRLELVEWNPIDIRSLGGVAYLILLALAVAVFVGSRMPVRRALAAMLACSALLPLAAVRHAPFFALTAVFVSGPHARDAFGRWWGRRWSTDVAGGRFRPLVAAGLAACALGLFGLAAARVSCIRVQAREHPVRAVALVADSGAAGHMAVFLEWGDYALWHVGPRVLVSGDTRREMAYSDASYRANLRFALGTGQWDTVLRSPDTTLALVSKKFPTFNLLALEPDWVLAVEDRISAVFARRGPVIERLRRLDRERAPADERDGCFP